MDVDFSWNAMTGGSDPFESKDKGYEVDQRFYRLKKDEEGGGVALIRFLPSELLEDGRLSTVFKVFRYNVRSKTNPKIFISEWSPSSIGKPDPFKDRWAELWNQGKKDEAKRYARSTRYIANIKVLKDPACPENEGKIFLLDMSQSLMEIVKNVIYPPKSEIALGAKPRNLFDPMEGYNFKLVAAKEPNGFTGYSRSSVAPESSAIYNSRQEAIEDIQSNCYKLSEWAQPEAYKSYDELKAQLDNLDAIDNGAQVSQKQTSDDFDLGITTTTIQTETPAQQPLKTETKTEPVKPAQQVDNLNSLIDSFDI